MLSLTGKIAMYRVFRANLDPSFRFSAALATLFVPSFVFWSAGMIKEAVALAGLGWSFFGLHQWIRYGRVGQGSAIMAAGSVPVLLIKPYIAFPFLLAAGCWYYWARSLRRGRLRIRPAYVVVGALLACGGIVLLGHYFPEYAVDRFSDQTAQLQHIGRRIRGGSTYELSAEVPKSLAGQFAYAPAALVFALFRPTLFEVRNLLILANSVETTLLTLLFLRLVVKRNLGNVRRQIAEDPFLVFCIVFVVAFGTAVGLASTNVGTLSRYRAPLLPFFVALLLVLVKPISRRSKANNSQRAPREQPFRHERVVL
jgi:NADH:ubiquinone oxidoreductase subunit K